MAVCQTLAVWTKCMARDSTAIIIDPFTTTWSFYLWSYAAAWIVWWIHFARLSLPFESMQNRIYRQSTQRREGTKVIKMTLRVFKASYLIQTVEEVAVSPNAPLWHNPWLCEFHSQEDGLFWAIYDVQTVAQLYTVYKGGLLSPLQIFNAITI